MSSYTLMIIILMKTLCSAPSEEKALVSTLNQLQAFIFPGILIIHENNTVLLASQMEILLFFFKEKDGKKMFAAKPENPTLLFRICLFVLEKPGK